MIKRILTISLLILTVTISGCVAGPKVEKMQATIKTSMGDIEIELHSDLTPETVRNFIELAKAGRYDNVPFHRVIEGFMIQTGDFENGNGTGGYSYNGPGTYLQDEFAEGLTHIRGAVSMANRGPNTGGSQFFIVHAQDGTPWLDGHHAIFGQVTSGMEVVDAIATAETDGNDRPLEDILILSVEIK